MTDQRPEPTRRRYVWPWFVLAAVILAVALAILWMSFAVRRTREMRDPDAVPAQRPSAAQTNGA